MDICKTDYDKIIKYLSDAQRLYDAIPSQSCSSRAHMIRSLIHKLNKKNGIQGIS